jgi:hypothetical protein
MGGYFGNVVDSWTKSPESFFANAATGGMYGMADAARPDYETRNDQNSRDRNNLVNQMRGSMGPQQRDADYDVGLARGKQEFYDDPDMLSLRAKREDLAKGFDGQELGALREQARSDLSGQRSKYLGQLSSNLAKGGVGGARAAAMRGAADANFAGKRAEQERAINVEQANQIRKGTDSLQDFYFRQKYGKLGSAITEQQLGVAERTAAAQTAAAMFQPKKGAVGQLLGDILG